jgi:transketolase
MTEYGLDAMKLIETVENIVGKKFNITENSLTKTYTPAVHSNAKAEAL